MATGWVSGSSTYSGRTVRLLGPFMVGPVEPQPHYLRLATFYLYYGKLWPGPSLTRHPWITRNLGLC